MQFLFYQLGSIKEGDFIVEISGIDVKWYTHRQLTKMIQACGNSLDVKVITPMDRNYLKVYFFNFNYNFCSDINICLCSRCLAPHQRDRYQPDRLVVHLECHQERPARQERLIKRNCVVQNRQRDVWAVCQVVDGIRFDDHKV